MTDQLAPEDNADTPVIDGEVETPDESASAETPKPKGSRRKAEAPASDPGLGNDGKPRTIAVQAKLLKAAVAAIDEVIERRNSIPILSNLMIHAHHGRAQLMGTDLDLQCVRWLDVEQDGADNEGGAPAFAIAACSSTLKQILSKIDGEASVTLTLTEPHKMLVTAGRSRFTLPTLPVEDMPVMVDEHDGHRFEIGAFGLAAMIAAVRFAMSTDETRYYLNGIYLHAAETTGPTGDGEGMLLTLRGVATDGHRLGRFDLPQPDGAGALAGAIVPRKAVGVIDKLLDGMGAKNEDGGAVVDVEIGTGKARFDFGETVLTTKLVDGSFPDYTRVIPTANEKIVLVDPASLSAAIARVTVMADSKTRAVRVDLAPDLITVSCVSPEYGEAREDVPCDYDGEALTIGFNATYLGEALARIAGGIARIELADAAGPVLVRDSNAEAAGLFVVMPMRV